MVNKRTAVGGCIVYILGWSDSKKAEPQFLNFTFQSCNDLLETEDQDASEVTPLLLAARLHDLLRAPRDTGRRVR